MQVSGNFAFLAIRTRNAKGSGYMSVRVKVQGSMLRRGSVSKLHSVCNSKHFERAAIMNKLRP